MPKIPTRNEVDLAQVIRNNDKWWSGELGRPIFNIMVWMPAATGGDIPWFLPSYPAGTTPERIVDNEFRRLDNLGYLGDGFPVAWMNFGPGVLAAMVGGEGRATPETVWFEPGRFAGKELADFSIRFNPEAEWAKRLAALYREAASRSGVTPVVLGMTDLGGSCDVLAALRGSEQLLMDLFDQPEEVKRLLGEETAAWLEAFDYFDALLRQGSVQASSCWAAILSSSACYMLQCDFSYMISPAMFGEFVKPELVKYAAKLPHALYHLDGKGQIGHIPHIAAIPGVDGIQWVPGDGQPQQYLWPEVFEEIEHHNLKLQLIGPLDNVERCLKLLKHPERAHITVTIAAEETERALRLLAEYGA